MEEVNFEIKQMFAYQNKTLRELIISKVHLIEGGEMPDSFVKFFTSTSVWDLYAAATPNGFLPPHLKTEERVIYPLDFDDHIITTTERLKARLAELRAAHAVVLPST